jgi:hypothetical protein
VSNYEYYRNLTVAVTSIVFGTILGWTLLTQENGGFPNVEELLEAAGQVTWVESYDYGIRFGLNESDKNFNYMSKMDGQGLVYESLANSGDKHVKILYRGSDPNSPIYSDKKYFNVFQIESGGFMVRSLSESEKAWRSDNFLSPFLIAMFTLGGIYIGNKTLRARKNA